MKIVMTGNTTVVNYDRQTCIRLLQVHYLSDSNFDTNHVAMTSSGKNKVVRIVMRTK